MKGKTKIFAVIVILFLFSLFPQNSTAFQKTNSTASTSAEFTSVKIDSVITLHYERVLIDGVWWIFVYDKGKLMESFPE